MKCPFLCLFLRFMSTFDLGTNRCEPQKKAYLDYYHKLQQQAVQAQEERQRTMSDLWPPNMKSQTPPKQE